LNRRDWVTAEPGRPVIFVPKSPRERLDAEWADVTRSFEKAAADLDAAYAGRSVVASWPVWFIRDEVAIAQRLAEIARSARRQLATTVPFMMHADEAAFFPLLEKAARAGRRVRVIVAPAVPVRLRGKPWSAMADAGVEFRRMDIPFRITVADFESALLIPPRAPAERPVAIWNPLPDFVKLLAPTYEQLWSQASPLAEKPGAAAKAPRKRPGPR
jgi:sugar-specific transcriptional regulator TrmB